MNQNTTPDVNTWHNHKKRAFGDKERRYDARVSEARITEAENDTKKSVKQEFRLNPEGADPAGLKRSFILGPDLWSLCNCTVLSIDLLT